VGGDFYDFLPINSEQSAVVIGDVVGHGIRASLVMARIMGMIRSDPTYRGRPRQLITALNRMLLDLGDRVGSVLPCSVFYAVLDEPTGTTFFINAGHPQPLLFGRNSAESLALGPRNPLLGVEDFDPREGCHTFQPGQRLVMYTDGLVEATNAAGDMFGLPRLRQAIARNADSPADECAQNVFRAIDEFRQESRQMDDETIVVMDRAWGPD
jgi:sigma-B regulation protein RsbU (phosphoserine phosphatase)